MVMGTRNTINADIGSDFGIEEYSNVWVNEEVTDITDHTGTIAEWTYADRTSVNFYIKYGAVGLSGGGSAGETAYATTDNNIFQILKHYIRLVHLILIQHLQQDLQEDLHILF